MEVAKVQEIVIKNFAECSIYYLSIGMLKIFIILANNTLGFLGSSQGFYKMTGSLRGSPIGLNTK